jgi:hypothetical protein
MSCKLRRKRRSFENTEIDEEAWLLGNPHKSELGRKKKKRL